MKENRMKVSLSARLRRRLQMLLSAVLIAGMFFSSLPGTAVQAADQKSGYFTDTSHEDIKYADMKYSRYDPAEYFAALDKMISLSADSAHLAEVKKLYEFVCGEYNKIGTLYQLANSAVNINVNDAQMTEELSYTYTTYMKMDDQLKSTMKKVLELPCGEGIEPLLSASTVKDLKAFEPMTEEELKLEEEEQELLQSYKVKQLEVGQLKGEVDGIEMSAQEATAEFLLGTIDLETYVAYLTDQAKKSNSYLGDTYLKLVALRNKQAKLQGYNNYAEYSFEVYKRDYTSKDVQAFSAAVKKYVVKPFTYLSEVYDAGAESAIREYKAEETLAVMKKYIPELGPEIEESFTYFTRNELYNLEYSPNKVAGAYTAELPSYGSAFIFTQPYGNAFDFFTLIHEFGHFNAFYWEPSTWERNTSIDVAEVHSQGLEALFYHFYPEIFGEDAQAMEENSLTNLLGAYIQGCMVNELETYAYTAKNLTLAGLNQKYLSLAKDYGMVDAKDRRTEAYGWSDVHHVFTSPMYYISYATSVAAVFELWKMEIKDYDAAVDLYLKYTAQGLNVTFLQAMSFAGLGNPLSAKQVEATGLALMEQYKLEERMEAMYGVPETEKPDQNDKKDKTNKADKTDKVNQDDKGSQAEKTGKSDKSDKTDKSGKSDQTVKPNNKTEDKKTAVYPTCYVRSGDTLAKIGNRFQVDWKEIAHLNKISAPYRIYAGDTLKLPLDAVMRTETYKVQRGETLGSIAAKLGMDWTKLAVQAGVKAPYTIYEGQILKFQY